MAQKTQSEPIAGTYDGSLVFITKNFFDGYKKKLQPGESPNTAAIKEGLFEMTQESFNEWNLTRRKGWAKITVPQSLCPIQIAMCIQEFDHICNVKCSEEEREPLLSVYMADGPYAGTYQSDPQLIRRLIRKYNSNLTHNEMRTVIEILEEQAPLKQRCMNKDLIPVNNGIFNYKTKELSPFTPDLIFLHKSSVDYVPNPGKPVFVNPEDGSSWDFDSWLADLHDDPEITELLWQIIGASVRPFNDWGKAAILYSPSGDNGKGTFLVLLRGICGRETCTTIPITDFGKRFQLEPLIGRSAVFTDENNTAGYLDDCSNFKSVITHDPIGIDRKNLKRVTYDFYGLVVMCANKMPRVRDNTGSFHRRLLIIPFEKTFLGRERKYIKNDYLKRKEVLEYVLHKVLHMDYDRFSEPAACKRMLEAYKIFTDTIREFWAEFNDRFEWDLLPYDFLYDLYLSWFKRDIPSGIPTKKSEFKAAMRTIAANDPVWHPHMTKDGKDIAVRPQRRMTDQNGPLAEPLIKEYGLHSWQDYSTGAFLCYPALKVNYKGLVRRVSRYGAAPLPDPNAPAGAASAATN